VNYSVRRNGVFTLCEKLSALVVNYKAPEKNYKAPITKHVPCSLTLHYALIIKYFQRVKKAASNRL
jgi:hypothetical protein